MRVKLQAMKMRMETQDIGSKTKFKCRINLAIANAGLANFSMERKGKEAFSEDYATKLSGDEAFSVVSQDIKHLNSLLASEGNTDHIIISSWCRYPLYEADFGLGKPTWVTIYGYNLMFKNSVFLMDTRDGSGIEAWITLSEEDMALFEQDKDLLGFASSNPTVQD
ncbi:BAHD acyltransferase BIA1-like [Juglans regia]|uniref:BAHD acyltransferase BIA1-like n=1 Tax=Juglans regia TaxID=51240 RepID=A0A6P9EF57_JUGRE|nr:BAHD acyltransferase BIA1-like [Juglans regia]